MLLLGSIHSDPAFAVVVIFALILGSFLAVTGASGTLARERRHDRR
jgi:hypothetical protein